ncbi:MAG: DNA-3-methyladenine glycosylase 2 family protein [Chloroflexota bacterium]
MQPHTVLNSQSMLSSLAYLSEADSDLADLYAQLGPPPLWDRTPGFPTLVHIILEQQVSLASARAAFEKLKSASGTVTPASFLQYSDEELKTIGFSRQKTRYCRLLARAVLDGALNLENLPELDDDSVRAALTAVKGIGPWTADIYLLMVLLRPDTWPRGDLALAAAVQDIKQLPARPSPPELDIIARPWQPCRAVAARLLWFSYLRKRGLT